MWWSWRRAARPLCCRARTPSRAQSEALPSLPPARFVPGVGRGGSGMSSGLAPAGRIEQLSAYQDAINTDCGMVDADDEIAVDTGCSDLLKVAIVPDGVSALAPNPPNEKMHAGRAWPIPPAARVGTVETRFDMEFTEYGDPSLVA